MGDVKAEALRRREAGESVPSIAAALGLTEGQVRGYVRRNAGRAAPPEPAPVPRQEMEAFEKSAAKSGVTVRSEWQDDENAADLWERWEGRNAKTIERVTKRHKFIADIAGNRPVAVAFASDQHISQGPIDLQRMREDAELIRDTKDLYVVLGGDGVDNHIKIRSAMIASEGPAGDQWLLYNHYLGILREKVIAVVSGNHDDWTKQACGVDQVRALALANKLCYAPSEAQVELRIGSQAYGLGVRHRYRMNSTYNQGHAPKQWMRMSGQLFDIAAVCHHHEASVESFRWAGHRRWVCRPGSYQITSSYTKDFGWDDAVPTCPTFIVFPETHRVIGFDDLRDAVGAMRGYA